jgi:hypothetical protein
MLPDMQVQQVVSYRWDKVGRRWYLPQWLNPHLRSEGGLQLVELQQLIVHEPMSTLGETVVVAAVVG